MKIPGLVGHLKSLSDKGMAVGPLLSLLLPRLGSSILDKKLYLKVALQLVKELPLGQLLLQNLHLVTDTSAHVLNTVACVCCLAKDLLNYRIRTTADNPAGTFGNPFCSPCSRHMLA